MKKLFTTHNFLILLFTTFLISCGGSEDFQKKRMTLTTTSGILCITLTRIWSRDENKS